MQVLVIALKAIISCLGYAFIFNKKLYIKLYKIFYLAMLLGDAVSDKQTWLERD